MLDVRVCTSNSQLQGGAVATSVRACLTLLTGETHACPACLCWKRCVSCLRLMLQVTAIFGSSLEVMISVFGETPSAGQVREAGRVASSLL